MKTMPLIGQVAAVSCGIVGGEPVLDLDYDEDSSADADANFVLTDGGGIVEIQATAEKTAFSEAQFLGMLASPEKAPPRCSSCNARRVGAA